MSKFTRHKTDLIKRIQNAALAVRFSEQQRKSWTRIDDIQHALDRLSSDALMMQPNNQLTLEQRQEYASMGLLRDLQYVLCEILTQEPKDFDIALNDHDLKKKVIALSKLVS